MSVGSMAGYVPYECEDFRNGWFPSGDRLRYALGFSVFSKNRSLRASSRRDGQVTAYARQAEMPGGRSPCCPAFSTGPDNA